MAFALVASVAAGSAAGGAITTAGVDTTGANLLVVFYSEYVGSGATESISDSKSNAYTYLTAYSSAAQERVRIAYKLSPTVSTGSADHTFTSNNGTSYSSICAMAFSGVDIFDPGKDVGTVDGGASPATAGSVTPSENDCLVIFGAGYRATHSGTSINGGFTIPAGLNIDYVGSTRFGAVMAYLIQTSAAASNPAYAFTGSNGWSAAQAVFQAAAGAGGTVVPVLMNQYRQRWS